MPIPADKTDMTGQVADHAPHHNQLADAVNDHETRLVVVENAIPIDGTVGQALVVESEGPQVIGWQSMKQVPSGGTNHQVLTKTGSGPWAFDWEDPQVGEQVLPPTSSADAGDVVTYNGSSVVWDAPTVSSGVPDSSGASIGDVLTKLLPGVGWSAPAAGIILNVSSADASGTPADDELWIKYTP